METAGHGVGSMRVNHGVWLGDSCHAFAVAARTLRSAVVTNGPRPGSAWVAISAAVDLVNGLH